MKRWILLLTVAVSLLVPSLLTAQELRGTEGKLTVIEQVPGSERLDPAFEMIMEKLDADLNYILSSPFRITPKGTATIGMTLLTAFFLVDRDEEYLEDVQGTKGKRSDKLYGRLDIIGKHVPEITAGVYLLGYFTDDMGLKSHALQGLEAAALTALFSGASAYMIGHGAPNQTTSSGEFESFAEYHSMPEMYSALAFSLASVAAYNKGLLNSIVSYSIAGGVAMSRVYENEAWPSDVFLGAVVGITIGRTVAYLSSNSHNGRVSLEPVILASPGSATGLKITYRF